MSGADGVNANNLKGRKQKILIAVIELFVKNNEPVGSKAIVKMLGDAVSSATVRNDMAELSAMGYLEQPHTSAGRIPTAAAFRLYIDKWLPKKNIPKQEQRQIDYLLENSTSNPESLISDASKTLADMTGYAAVSTTLNIHSDKISQIQILRVSSRSVAMLIMTDSGFLRSRVHRFEQEISDIEIEVLHKALMINFIDAILSEITLPRIQGLIVALGEFALQCAPALITFEKLIGDFIESEVLLSGQLNLLKYPDYDQKHAKDLLHFLAQGHRFSGIISSFPSGLRVVIGNESISPELSGSSIIATSYIVGNNGGSLGIVGPVRMDYAATISRLEYIAKLVETAFRDIFEDDSQ